MTKFSITQQLRNARKSLAKQYEGKKAAFIVCGGRDFTDYEFLAKTLDDIKAEYSEFRVIEGDAPGADKLAGMWCYKRGLPYNIRPANWHKHGKAAGPIRNQEMLELILSPEFQNYFDDIGIIAFPGGTGTADMVERGRKAGLIIKEIKR